MRVDTLISREEIAAKVKDLAKQIEAEYKGRRPLLVAVLKGSVVFLSDLMRELGDGYPIDFMAVSSYNGQASTGAVEIRLDLGTNVEGRDVLIVEDIVDTGLTLQYLLGVLRARGPASVKVATLLFKRQACKAGEVPDYIGFEIPSDFVVGYGMDLDEEHRNLPFIGILRPGTP